jgi:hypothetical protein
MNDDIQGTHSRRDFLHKLGVGAAGAAAATAHRERDHRQRAEHCALVHVRRRRPSASLSAASRRSSYSIPSKEASGRQHRVYRHQSNDWDGLVSSF